MVETTRESTHSAKANRKDSMRVMGGLFFGGYLAGENQREGYAANEDAQDDDERGGGAYVEAEELVADHLDADETEKDSEAVLEEPEHVGDIAEEEEEGAEAHDGEDVGEIDDEGVGGDGEDGGDGVDGEDDVGELDDKKDEEEGRDAAVAVFEGEEVVAVHAGGDGEMLAGEADNGMVGGVDGFVAFVAEHLDAAEDEHAAEDGQDPREALN